MRNLREQIGRSIRDEISHLLQIDAELRDRFLPKTCVADLFRLWPIPCGPLRRRVVLVTAEFQNVPLRNSYVLEHLPRSVRQTLNPLAACFCRKTGDKVFQIDMRIAASQK